jgi:hypothetical protein
MKLLRVLSSKDLDEVNEFLDELKDGDQYKKRLKALEDQKNEINDLIEVHGKVKEIDGLNLKARQLKEGADRLVEDAQADREKAKKDSAEQDSASQRMIAARNKDASERFEERERALVTGENALGTREKAHARSLDDLAEREKEVAADMHSAVAIRTTYTEAVASLKTAIESTAKAL